MQTEMWVWWSWLLIWTGAPLMIRSFMKEARIAIPVWPK